MDHEWQRTNENKNIPLLVRSVLSVPKERTLIKSFVMFSWEGTHNALSSPTLLFSSFLTLAQILA